LYETSSHTGNRALDQAASGWELAGVLTFQTGPFLTVQVPGADPSGTNFANSYDNSTGSSRPDIVSGVSVVPSNQNIHSWINSAALATPPNNIGRLGDAPVGTVVGPGTQAVSLSLYRSFRFNERIACAWESRHQTWSITRITARRT
jgi:hypothetical protein